MTGCRKTAVLNMAAHIAVVFTLAGKTLDRWRDGYPTHGSVRANEGLQCVKPQPQRSVSASLLI